MPLPPLLPFHAHRPCAASADLSSNNYISLTAPPRAGARRSLSPPMQTSHSFSSRTSTSTRDSFFVLATMRQQHDAAIRASKNDGARATSTHIPPVRVRQRAQHPVHREKNALPTGRAKVACFTVGSLACVGSVAQICVMTDPMRQSLSCGQAELSTRRKYVSGGCRVITLLGLEGSVLARCPRRQVIHFLSTYTYPCADAQL